MRIEMEKISINNQQLIKNENIGHALGRTRVILFRIFQVIAYIFWIGFACFLYFTGNLNVSTLPVLTIISLALLLLRRANPTKVEIFGMLLGTCYIGLISILNLKALGFDTSIIPGTKALLDIFNNRPMIWVQLPIMATALLAKGGFGQIATKCLITCCGAGILVFSLINLLP